MVARCIDVFLTYADVCLTYANVCRLMPTYAGEAAYESGRVAGFCQRTPGTKRGPERFKDGGVSVAQVKHMLTYADIC